MVSELLLSRLVIVMCFSAAVVASSSSAVAAHAGFSVVAICGFSFDAVINGFNVGVVIRGSVLMLFRLVKVILPSVVSVLLLSKTVSFTQYCCCAMRFQCYCCPRKVAMPCH